MLAWELLLSLPASPPSEFPGKGKEAQFEKLFILKMK